MLTRCIVIAGLLAFSTPAHAQPITVVDGDTVQRGTEKWRIVGIDAPEIHGARCPAERQLGLVAAARLIALIEQRGARLVGDGRDKYGRRTGRLIIGWPTAGEEDWSSIALREGLVIAWNGQGRRPGWCGR
jgi:micrococcal nuclease